MYQLNVQQLSLLKKHYQEGQYDAAYKVITDSVSSEYSAYKWFDLASGINANQGYASAYIRGYTVIAEALGDVVSGEDMTIISRDQLQNASDRIARSVLSGIISNNGVLPDETDIYREDAQAAKDYLNLNDAEWGGIVPAAIGFINYEGEVPQGIENNTLMAIAAFHAGVYAGAAGTADAASSFINQLSSMFDIEVNLDVDSSRFSDFFSDIFDDLSSFFGGETSISTPSSTSLATNYRVRSTLNVPSVDRLVAAMSSFDVPNSAGSIIHHSFKEDIRPILFESLQAR